MVPGFPYVNRGKWGWKCDSLCYYLLTFRKQHNLQNAVFCEDQNCKDSCLIGSSHIQNDVEHFQNGLVHELYSLKVSQICKVHTSSHERTNEPYVTSNYENTGKTVPASSTTNYDTETNTFFVEKNVREYNFEGGANNCKLDKDTEGSNLNSKVKYLSIALLLNILFLLLVFIG